MQSSSPSPTNGTHTGTRRVFLLGRSGRQSFLSSPDGRKLQAVASAQARPASYDVIGNPQFSASCSASQKLKLQEKLKKRGDRPILEDYIDFGDSPTFVKSLEDMKNKMRETVKDQVATAFANKVVRSNVAGTIATEGEVGNALAKEPTIEFATLIVYCILIKADCKSVKLPGKSWKIDIKDFGCMISTAKEDFNPVFECPIEIPLPEGHEPLWACFLNGGKLHPPISAHEVVQHIATSLAAVIADEELRNQDNGAELTEKYRKDLSKAFLRQHFSDYLHERFCYVPRVSHASFLLDQQWQSILIQKESFMKCVNVEGSNDSKKACFDAIMAAIRKRNVNVTHDAILVAQGTGQDRTDIECDKLGESNVPMGHPSNTSHSSSGFVQIAPRFQPTQHSSSVRPPDDRRGSHPRVYTTHQVLEALPTQVNEQNQNPQQRNVQSIGGGTMEHPVHPVQKKLDMLILRVNNLEKEQARQRQVNEQGFGANSQENPYAAPHHDDWVLRAVTDGEGGLLNFPRILACYLVVLQLDEPELDVTHFMEDSYLLEFSLECARNFVPTELNHSEYLTAVQNHPAFTEWIHKYQWAADIGQHQPDAGGWDGFREQWHKEVNDLAEILSKIEQETAK